MKLKSFLLALVMCVLCAVPAQALQCDVDAPEDYLFGQPTSDDTIYEKEDPNVDRSKNTVLIPPGFGTPTSYLPGSGEYLTPNLVPGALSGGLVAEVGSVNYPTVDVTSMGGYPVMDTSISYTESSAGFTEVTDDLYYSDGNGSCAGEYYRSHGNQGAQGVCAESRPADHRGAKWDWQRPDQRQQLQWEFRRRQQFR